MTALLTTLPSTEGPSGPENPPINLGYGGEGVPTPETSKPIPFLQFLARTGMVAMLQPRDAISEHFGKAEKRNELMLALVDPRG